jgi:hypothetical protein
MVARGLAALAAALLCSCAGSGPSTLDVPPVESARSIEEVRAMLDRIAERNDPAAWLARARACEKLRALGGGSPPVLLADGDVADVAFLSKPGDRAAKLESGARLARHFLERSENPALCRPVFTGPLAEPLRRFVLASVAASFGEYGSRKDQAAALERMADVAEQLADRGELRPAMRDGMHRRARLYALRSVETASESGPPSPSADALKFCEFDLSRHLDEATRAADHGTRERASRGDPDRALDWYLLALSHYSLARECLRSPTTAQAQALGAQEIVIRSLTDLLCREP